MLGAVGSGERTYSLIHRAAGEVSSSSLNRALAVLAAKRLVETITPVSVSPSRETRYFITDTHLRFWLAFIGPYLPEIERGRGDQTLARIRKSWTSWRGRAIEPVVRESLRRLPSRALPAGTEVIGGYWTRTNNPEIDLVGADRGPVAKKITMVGSIKWQEKRPFDTRDLAALVAARARMPGTGDDTPVVTVSRTAARLQGVRVIDADELISGWKSSV